MSIQASQIRNYKHLLQVMFKINSVDPAKISTNLNVCKIKALLSRVICDLKDVNKQAFQLIQSPLKKRNESKTEPQSIQEVYQHLKTGYLVQKHSRNTKNAHAKFVFLSNDHKWLCWKSLDREDTKKFAISSIVKLVKHEYKDYIRDNIEQKNQNCCLLIVSTVRNLELEAASEYQADLLAYQLSRVLRSSQQMCHNYLYHRK